MATRAVTDSYDAAISSGKLAKLSTADFVALDVLGNNSPGIRNVWLSGSALTGSRFQIGFTNLAATNFTVLGCTNVMAPTGSWSVLGTATEIAVGQYIPTDTQTAGGSRCYHVRSQ